MVRDEGDSVWKMTNFMISWIKDSVTSPHKEIFLPPEQTFYSSRFSSVQKILIFNQIAEIWFLENVKITFLRPIFSTKSKRGFYFNPQDETKSCLKREYSRKNAASVLNSKHYNMTYWWVISCDISLYKKHCQNRIFSPIPVQHGVGYYMHGLHSS